MGSVDPKVEVMLDTTRIRNRRHELGLSIRSVAAQVGVVGAVIRTIEAGGNHHDVPLGVLSRLADALCLDMATIFAATPPSEPPTTIDDDVAALGSVLHSTGVLTSASVLCDVLGWRRDRLDSALDALDNQLRRAGLRLNRNPQGFGITRAVEATDGATITRAIRAHIARDGLNLTEASMLARLTRGDIPKDPSNPESVAIAVLIKGELLDHGTPPTPTAQAPLELSDAVRFSLLLDEEPDPVSFAEPEKKTWRPTGGYQPELAAK